MEPERWNSYTMTPSPPNSERRFPSSPRHYESVVHSPEHSLPDSMDPMDMTGSWNEQSGFPQGPTESDMPIFLPSHMTSVELHTTTTSSSSSLPIATSSRPFSPSLSEQEPSSFQFHSTLPGFDLDLASSAYFTSGVLATTDGMYPASGMNPRLSLFPTNYDWNYVSGFRQDPTMSYQVTQVESPHRAGSMHSASPLEASSLMESSIDLMQSPSVKLERSSSHGSNGSIIFPLSPHISDHAYQHSNAATHGSSQSSEMLYNSDESYVFVHSPPSRASTDSPVIVNANPVEEMSSSPVSDSSQPRKGTTRNTTRRRPSKEKRPMDMYMEQHPFTDEKSARKSQTRDGRNSKKIGGRQKGSHLDSQTAEHARRMRTLGSCWVCICQREKCEKLPGSDICMRCKNRQERERGIMLSNCQLGCNNQKLCTLKSFIVPDVLQWPYKIEATIQYENTQIYSFTSQEPLDLELSLLYAQLPIRVKLHEYQPKGGLVNLCIRYVLDTQTDTYVKQSKQAIPLALSKDDWASEDVTPYEDYLNSIINDRHKLRTFGETCYESFHNDFLRRLFEIFTTYEAEDDKENALLQDIYRMLLAAHIIGHVSYFSEEQLQKLPGKLANYFETNEAFATPGLANRQINSIFLRILDKVVKTVLDKLQGILRSSDSKAKWMGAFMCMLGMAMACEEVQSTTDTVGSNNNEYLFGCNEQAAKNANESIDSTFRMMCSLFHMKYKSFTPMKNPDSDEVRRRIGDRSIPTVKKIKELCDEKFSSFLNERRYAVPNNDNIAQYYGRQVARFLCDFWSPDLH